MLSGRLYLSSLRLNCSPAFTSPSQAPSWLCFTSQVQSSESGRAPSLEAEPHQVPRHLRPQRKLQADVPQRHGGIGGERHRELGVAVELQAAAHRHPERARRWNSTPRRSSRCRARAIRNPPLRPRECAAVAPLGGEPDRTGEQFPRPCPDRGHFDGEVALERTGEAGSDRGPSSVRAPRACPRGARPACTEARSRGPPRAGSRATPGARAATVHPRRALRMVSGATVSVTATGTDGSPFAVTTRRPA